jgi:hypothetical protein|tara:strand:- start:51 stop:2258 length:2208 start_codon:yes stop_codon:yes gene_type:complete
MEKDTLIKELLSELSYRSNEGYPILDNREHISIIAEILDEWNLTEIKNELIKNLLEADGETFTATNKETGETSVFKSKDNRDAAIEKGTHTKKEDSEEDDSKEKPKTSLDPTTSAGKDFNDSLPDSDAAKIKKPKNGVKSRVLPKEMDSTELGRVVSETGDTDVKNTMLDVGYGGYEKKTGSKPAPGGPGSAFNEIVSGELVLILEKYPDMTEDELADYSHKRFGNTKLGKEQKDTSGLVKNADIEKRREEAKGTGTHSKPQFPEQHKQVMKERATYSKSRVATASAIKKHKATQERIKNLQSNKLFGKETKTYPFYGAGVSIDAQVDMVNNAKGKVYLPNGTEVDKVDLIKFIKAGGGGMNPSDTATFVTDENGNLLVQFHSDKTTTSDIQDNSTLANEEVNYNSYIEKSSLSDEDKVACKKINKEDSDKMRVIEEKYNQQSVPIATNLLKLDKNKISKILDEDEGTMVQNMNDAIYGETARKSGDLSKINKKWDKYLPKGANPEDLTPLQKSEMINKFVADGGKLNANMVKSINKVALQYQKENPDTLGLDVKKLLSEQRTEVVKTQREKIRKMNNFTVDVDGVSVGAGTLMEAEENIRGFHLTMMDYPPKAYVKGDPSSITGTSLDVNMGGVVVNGEVLRGCLDVKDTTEFKQKFKLIEEEELTYDSEDRNEEGNRTGNVTGKKVFTYVVDTEGGRKELGYKSYRSKEGASGKTNNTMTYSTEMQKCFKSKS